MPNTKPKNKFILIQLITSVNYNMYLQIQIMYSVYNTHYTHLDKVRSFYYSVCIGQENAKPHVTLFVKAWKYAASFRNLKQQSFWNGTHAHKYAARIHAAPQFTTAYLYNASFHRRRRRCLPTRVQSPSQQNSSSEWVNNSTQCIYLHQTSTPLSHPMRIAQKNERKKFFFLFYLPIELVIVRCGHHDKQFEKYTQNADSELEKVAARTYKWRPRLRFPKQGKNFYLQFTLFCNFVVCACAVYLHMDRSATKIFFLSSNVFLRRWCTFCRYLVRLVKAIPFPILTCKERGGPHDTKYFQIGEYAATILLLYISLFHVFAQSKGIERCASGTIRVRGTAASLLKFF